VKQYTINNPPPQLTRKTLKRYARIFSMNLRQQMKLLARIMRELILSGDESFMIAAVVCDNFAPLAYYHVPDDDAEQIFQMSVIRMAMACNAQSLIFGHDAWAAPIDDDIMPIDHPERFEVIGLTAKDRAAHIGGMQRVYRSEKNITFGELEIYEGIESWLDNFPLENPMNSHDEWGVNSGFLRN
jgi:hypothetical protein